VLHVTILTKWLDFSRGGFLVRIEILPGGGGGGCHFGFVLTQVLCVGPAAVAVVMCASASEG
jgi:hypothetical protein